MNKQLKTFTFISNDQLIRIIQSAQRHLIFAAPSIAESVAKSICIFRDKNETAAVRVIVDADPEAFRLGFGEQAGVKLLAEKQIDVRCTPGLRIAVLVADESAWVYSPTPEIIFEQPTAEISNAVQVNVEFAKQILFSIAPDISVVAEDNILDQSVIADDSVEITFETILDQSTKTILDETFLTDELVPEIGVEKLTEQSLTTIETELKENPPQKFDMARKVRVYQGHIQFVELSFTGCRLTSKTITLPQYILSVSDEALRDRVRTTCRILDDNNILSVRMKVLEEQVKKLRRLYVRSLGERYGSVILRKKRAEFDLKVAEIKAELEKLKETLKSELNDQLDKSREGLIQMLLPGLLKNPPQRLLDRNNTVDAKFLEEFLNLEIEKQLPLPEKLVESMNFYCDYKDVTFKMLNDKDFAAAVSGAYPDEEFAKLYSEEQTMAQRNNSQLPFQEQQ